MKHDHPSATTLPEQLQGTRAGVFHLLNQKRMQEEPEPTPNHQKQQETRAEQDHKSSRSDALWHGILESDNFLFLD